MIVSHCCSTQVERSTFCQPRNKVKRLPQSAEEAKHLPELTEMSNRDELYQAQSSWRYQQQLPVPKPSSFELPISGFLSRGNGLTERYHSLLIGINAGDQDEHFPRHRRLS